MINEFFDRLSIDLTQLLENPIDYNVTIEIDEAPNNQIFKVHSYILLSRSPYFKKKFSETPFNDDHVKALKMSDISVKLFNIIIKYIYGGIISLEKLETSIVFDLLITSNEFELDELVKYLQTHLVNNNASWLKSNFAKVHLTSYEVKNLGIIQKFCNDIIAKHPNTIFGSDNFHTLPEDALISILKRDDLQLEESKIWEYVIQWGKAKNSTLPTNLDEWTNDNFLTLKETLKKCLPHIRYFYISGEDVLDKLYSYLQLLEHQLWLDINTRLIAPNRSIVSIVLPPRKLLNIAVPTRTTPIPLFSDIITDEHALEISSWINKLETNYIEDNPYEFKLLARGSRDGFDVSTIYNICDKISNTVIILKVEGTGEILGGYNPLEWDDNSDQYKYTQDSFVFSLKTENLEKSILSRVIKKFGYAINNYPKDSCLSFGDALHLVSNLNTEKKCFCRDNTSYPIPIRSGEFILPYVCFAFKTYEKCFFSVEEYEVYMTSQVKKLEIIQDFCNDIIAKHPNTIYKSHALEILSWIDKKETPYIENISYEFGLLIKGNRDGFNVETIYEICDKVSNTIIVFKSGWNDSNPVYEQYPRSYNPDNELLLVEWMFSIDTFIVIMEIHFYEVKNSMAMHMAKLWLFF
ncbi:hypothetical protein Glove_350g36 [Diversispora epigaea]|uniref:BTB domain-containing protein n=1 Tax=Diversispora epigaea TaxID=1348612 RepID=A0A397HCR0_9GLOM|nr:hypothetical protein Glove_350g36 [Diversispora epigaea]